ncbi:hypothetical protein [Clostridium sp. ZBS15]|uniref:hypothetical protein n=1 Tax=Clostridium sp. ZBS15 TaxID=2949969 RepID=UPI00207A68D4|nr:hypothetical protein [Clostridium sp. ZBS15]
MGNSKCLLFAYLYCFVVGFLVFLKGYKMYKTKKYLIKLKNRVIKDEVKLSKYEGTLLCVSSIIYIIMVIVMFNPSPIYHDIKDYICIRLLIGFAIVCYIIHFIFLNLYTTKKKNKS